MKHLVLLGAGHAHVHVLSRLAQLAQKAPLACKVSLIAPYAQQIYSGMLPGHLAGHYSLAQCTIDLRASLSASGVAHVPGRGIHIDTQLGAVQVHNGSDNRVVPFDWLSVNTGPVLDRQRIEQAIPGAREHALFLRPIEAFSPLWEKVLTLGQERSLRIAVVGAGSAGVELAMAMQVRLPHCAVSLISGPAGPVANYPEPVRERVRQALRQRGIAVLPATCTAIEPDCLVLDQLTRLRCDVPVLALGAQAPAWLATSGLALDEQGFIVTNAQLQSTSHSNVFAAGDVASRPDAPHAKSGVYAIRSAAALATNLIAAASGTPLQSYTPPARTLNLLACGDRRAIASWGNWSAQGRWVWWWKDWIDRRFMARYGTR